MTCYFKPIPRLVHTPLYYAAVLLIGRITGLARPSVHPSVCSTYGLLSGKRKRAEKLKLEWIFRSVAVTAVCQSLSVRKKKIKFTGRDTFYTFI